MSCGKTLLVFTFVLILTAGLIACVKNQSAGQGKETPPQALKSNASKNEVPDLAPTLDGPLSISYSEIFKEGSTSWSSISFVSKKSVLPLPPGYESINGLAYVLESKASFAGFNITSFQVPSIRDQETFAKLAVLHLEFDELSPQERAWMDNTVLPARWSKEYFVNISKESYNQASPDFATRRIAAIHEGLGTFVLARTSDLSMPSRQPFTNMQSLTESIPTRVTVGENVTYRITVYNKGPRQAGDVNLQNEMDTDIDFLSATSNQGKCKQSVHSDGRTICHLGALPVGATATITIVGRVRYNVAMDQGPRQRYNSTLVVFKERAVDMTNSLNIARQEIFTLTVPRAN